MTTLLSWLSVDARGPSAIYIVADSRITWGSEQKRWDSGRKVFAAPTPDIFGYCGDVVFPSLVLGQLTELANNGLLWDTEYDAASRHQRAVEFLKASFARRHNAPDQNFTIVHAARDGSGLTSAFHAWRIDYFAKSGSWMDVELDSSAQGYSKLLVGLGSGNAALGQEIYSWQKSPQGGTARAIFSAFCDALSSGADPLTGGMPQLVSLDRQSAGKTLGFVSDGQRYIHGVPLEYTTGLDAIEWVDALFRIVSPATLDLLSGAQQHARVAAASPFGFSKFLRRTRPN